MNRFSKLLFIIIIFYFSYSTGIAASTPEISFLTTCLEEGVDVAQCPKSDLGEWWVVSPDTRLKKVQVKSRSYESGGYKGEKLYIKGLKGKEPLYLIRGIDGLKEGPIQAELVTELWLEEPLDFKIILGEQKRKFRLTFEKNSKYAHTLFLEGNTKNGKNIKQKIMGNIKFDIDFPTTLNFFGDLEGDGWPDIVVIHGYNCGAHFALFLSSEAKPNKLVKYAASTDLGCL